MKDKKGIEIEVEDKNGIEIECLNCRHYEYCDDKFYLMDALNDCFEASNEARIQELQNENALLKDGESHITDIKLSPKFIKSIIRAVNSEVEIPKRELCFTDEELNLIRNTFQSEIREDKCGWSAEKRIIAKCDALLKVRKG